MCSRINMKRRAQLKPWKAPIENPRLPKPRAAAVPIPSTRASRPLCEAMTIPVIVMEYVKKYKPKWVSLPTRSRKGVPVLAQSGCLVSQRTIRRMVSSTNVVIPRIIWMPIGGKPPTESALPPSPSSPANRTVAKIKIATSQCRDTRAG